MNKKRISILGSTGSIGTQTLEAAENCGIEVVGLTADKNIELLEQQIRRFKPRAAAVRNIEAAAVLKKRISDLKTKVYEGKEGLSAIAVMEEADTVVTSIVGIAGLVPTLEAIKKKKDIALANKETLVTAGEIVVAAAQREGVKILPVDSEHSAIFQCLLGNNKKRLNKIILTASGGPFRGKSMEDLEHVTREQALKHPNWIMGSKITIDSATLMNKGLEVIEAKWLFGLTEEQIEVVVHPQSVVHSAVEYEDGSIIAQLGSPDMRIPIQFALTYPDRLQNNFSRLNLLEMSTLTFEKPDFKTFKCLELAFRALREGGTVPVVMNAANEIAVDLFLKGDIGFLDIPRIIEQVMNVHQPVKHPELKDILAADSWAREYSIKIKQI
ncbi:MAG: 1-deoxy-D-xylulose-5-phosphate reductoisomerase [Bacillota bacterium]|nr:1-deoxy-D-xylulose-5-phosphate reductoisomerase [Bacillota bacterium]